MTTHATTHEPHPTAHAAHPHKPPDAARIVGLLQGMPWVFEHRYGCPASSAGPCTCGASDLKAAMHPA